MVEPITDGALRKHVRDLEDRRILDGALSTEIGRLVEESGRLSNWTDVGTHLERAGFRRLAGVGPASKFLRVLAFLLESLDRESEKLTEKGVRVTRIELTDAVSGCSDFSGRVRAEGIREGAESVTVFDGPFEWDCAVHGLGQSEAARELGYRCMVAFPKVELHREATIPHL